MTNSEAISDNSPDYWNQKNKEKKNAEKKVKKKKKVNDYSSQVNRVLVE